METPPTFDFLFNSVEQQLMRPPSSSDIQLSQILRGASFAIPNRALDAVSQIDGPTVMALKPQYQIPTNASFLVVLQENRQCDVIRRRYRIAPFIIDVARTKYIEVIRVLGFHPPPELQGLEAVHWATSMLFVEDTPFDLVILSENRLPSPHKPVYGKQKRSFSRVYLVWQESFRFLWEDQAIYFVALAETGRGQTLIPRDVDKNLDWFTYKPPIMKLGPRDGGSHLRP